MISIAAVSGGHAQSYFIQGKDDYYQGSEHESMQTKFGGQMCETLGLSRSEFDGAAFTRLVGGDYGGLELRQAASKFETKDRKARAGFDVTVSAPKSISIQGLVLGDKRLIEAHNKANDIAMKFVEQQVRIRVTVDGRRDAKVRQQLVQPASGVAWASFGHTMSRLRNDGAGGDCQLHTHNVIFKNAIGPDGKLTAIDARNMMQTRKEADAVYKQALQQMVQELGYKIQITKDGFELAGYSRDEIMKFSDGRVSVEKFLAENPALAERVGLARAADLGNQATRASKKDLNIDPADRQAWWVHKATERGIDLAALRERVQAAIASRVETQAPGRDVVDAVQFAAEHLTERSSTFTMSDMVASSVWASSYQLTPEAIRAEIVQRLAAGDFIARPDGKMTTRERVSNEQAILSIYKDSIGQGRAVASQDVVDAGIKAFEAQKGFSMTAGQRGAVNELLTGGNRVSLVVGDAGTGKSTSMEAVLSVATASGWTVRGLAPTGQAKLALEDAGLNTITTKRAERDNQFWSRVHARTLIVVDEAGLIDAKLMATLMRKAEEKGARIAFVGDHKQYASVEAGAAFTQLQAHATALADKMPADAKIHQDENGKQTAIARLDEMRRAKTDELRELHTAARDLPAEALVAMYERGRVTSIANEDKRLAYIADQFAAMTPEQREASLVLTGTNADKRALNAAIRERLNLAGGVEVNAFERLDLTRAEAKLADVYQEGQTVRFNSAAAGFRKGEACEVASANQVTGTIVLRRKDGQELPFTPGRDGHAVSVGVEERINLAAGDLVRFTGAIEKLGILNGDRAKVLAIDVKDRTMTIQRLTDKAEIKVELRERGLPLVHGYTTTGHSAQGLTMDQKGKLFLHMRHDDPTVTRNAFYTSVTRSTKHVEMVTNARKADQIAELGVKVQREVQLDTALQKGAERRARPKLAEAIWDDKTKQAIRAPKDWQEKDGQKRLAASLKQHIEKVGHNRVQLTGSRDFVRTAIESAREAGIEIKWQGKALEIQQKLMETAQASTSKQAQQQSAVAGGQAQKPASQPPAQPQDQMQPQARQTSKSVDQAQDASIKKAAAEEAVKPAVQVYIPRRDRAHSQK